MGMDGEAGANLPVGWAWAQLGELCEIKPPLKLGGIARDVQVPFVPMAAVEPLTNRISLDLRRPLHEVATGFTRFAAGDVLFAKITPCMENGKIAVVPDEAGPAAFGSTEFHVLRPRPGVEPLYLRHFLVQQHVRDRARAVMSGAVGQQRVPESFLRDLTIPVPPSAEQARIVARVEELFAELDEAEAALSRGRVKLAECHASLLYAACTGALTAAWRAANPIPAEDGASLLHRIHAERRRAWEHAEYARLVERGRSVRGDAWKARYVEPERVVSEGLPDLPSGWVWASLDQLTHRITSGSRDWGKQYASEGPALIRAQNIRTDALVTADLARVRQPAGDAEARTRVKRDDLLITITGANVTKAAHVAEEIGEAFVSQHVGLCRPVLPELAGFLHLAVISEGVGRKQLSAAAYGAGKPGLNLLDLARLALPLPPRAEQAEIMRRVTKAVEMSLPPLEEATNLRQSVLHAAFSGRLLPQGLTTDEPASALLVRIRTSGAATLPRRRPQAPAQPRLSIA